MGSLLNAVFTDFPFPVYSIIVNKPNRVGACVRYIYDYLCFCINIHIRCARSLFYQHSTFFFIQL